MNTMFLIALILFWSILLYYSLLIVTGVLHRKNKERLEPLEAYPSLDIFIPSHNEGIVMAQTLTAMTKLEYPGNMQIYVLNDNSQDNTGQIAEQFAAKYSYIHHIEVPDSDEPKGKSRVLNYGLSISNGEYFIVYDADNQPNPDAAVRLMEITMRTPNACGAVGCVRTLNAEATWLTRFIAIEFKVFQLMMQSGRYFLHRIGSLPGTNMLLKRSILLDLGGYDPYALAEDGELTIRLASKGYIIAVDYHSQTWEQEPQTLKALIKQRTRWLQGNFYVMAKFFKEPTWWNHRCLVHLVYYISIYIFFTGLLFSTNIVFVLSLSGIVHIESDIPYLLLWICTYLIYTSHLVIALWYDKKITYKYLISAFLMYFSYAQLFIPLVVRAFLLIWKDKKKGTISWDKTERVVIKE